MHRAAPTEHRKVAFDLEAQTPIISEMVRMVWERASGGCIAVPHVHHFHTIGIILEGAMDMRLEGLGAIRLEAGEALLVPPLVRHEAYAGLSLRHAGFKFHVAPRYWPIFGSIRRLRLSSDLVKRVDRWATDANPPPPFQQQYATALATLCLIEIAQKFPQITTFCDAPEPLRHHLWQVLERIGNDPFRPWSIAELAAEARVSTPHFSRCFRKMLGRAPKQYLVEARMRAAARELVSEPSIPIKQISERAGYTSVHSFSHAFKRFFELSPGAYRHRPSKL